MKQTFHLFSGRIPESQLLSTAVHPRPRETEPQAPETRPTPMTKQPQMKRPATRAPAPASLAQVIEALEAHNSLSPTRLRDLRSAVNRVAGLLHEEPPAIQLDLPAIASKLATVNPIAEGLTPKSLANIRSDFLAAVRASGLKPVERKSRTPLSPAWTEMMATLSQRRAHIGLSRLARFASAKGIEPRDIDDTVLEGFIAAVREGSLHRKPNDLHRSVALIWNEVVKQHDLDLEPVTVPSFRRPAMRIDWALLGASFRGNVDKYLNWCGGSDPFDTDARSRALAVRTLRLRRDQIHAAVTALVESGITPVAITSLGDLVSPDAFKRILRRRLAVVGGKDNNFNRDLGEALVQIAREWVKVDAATLTELRRLVSKLPLPASGLTDKNKRFLRQFDDPAALRRLHELPGRLWTEVRRDQKPNFRTLAKAQAALAVAILSYTSLRPQNLTELKFGTHLFLHDAVRATSSLELAAGEVKNKTALAFDIPPQVAKMLIEYRDRIAPKIIGHRPERLFVNADGSAKSQATVAWLISNYLSRRAGIVLTPHQFRHLNARILLDAEPGSFETVKQLLGHKSIKTTVGSYAGIDSRRAARHHQRIVEQALEAAKPMPRRKRRA
jgi:integrase